MKNLFSTKKRIYYFAAAVIALVLSTGVSRGLGMNDQSVCSLANYCYDRHHIETKGYGETKSWGLPVVYKETADFYPNPHQKMAAEAHFTVVNEPFYAFVNFVFWMGLASAAYTAYERLSPKVKNSSKRSK